MSGVTNRIQRDSFRLASDRDYRRGVILGLTLAEVMLLLIFLLLLAAAALLDRAERRAENAVARSTALERDLGPMLDAFQRSGQAITSADELVAIVRRARDADLLESALAAARAAAAQNVVRQSEVEAARLERNALARELDAAQRDLVAAKADATRVASDGGKLLTYNELLQTLDTLPGGAGAHPEKTLANVIGQYRQAMQELGRLKGNGSGLPFCWVAPSGQPIYMLVFELRDAGFVVHEQQPRPRPEDAAWALLGGLPRDTLIRDVDLTGMAAPLVTEANRRQCRYAADVIDRTNAANKSGYRHLNYVLDLAFARRELNR
jgi:hypothetical protein